MKRSKFSLSHYKLMSMNQGPLVPCGCVEVLPGDSFRMASSMLIRVSPLAKPVMHPVHATIHHWFVPYRILWESWENFITGGPDGDDDSEFPVIASGAGFAVGSLADYLGLPTGVAGLNVSALPFRAYAKIFNEWYRDQDLVSPLAISDADGLDSITNTALVNRAWEKDYFTSSRPEPQKGPAVTIAVTGQAPVYGDSTSGQLSKQLFQQSVNAQPTGTVQWNAVTTDSSALGGGVGPTTDIKLGTKELYEANPTRLPPYADLTDSSSIDVIQFREAMALQRYEEARARYGSRYTEYLRYLGVRSSDARLQRPEYLGGGKQTIQFSEVLQTAPVDDEGVGNLRGHGIGAMRSNRFIRFFEEHGVIISLMSVKPRTMYFQGVPRMWNRRTKEDFWQKELQHVGQMEVLNKELYAAHSQPDGVFGYQDRYDEYRRCESSVAGEMRSVLKDWHMAREFSTDPALNATFVTASPTDRIYQTSLTDQLQVMVMHSIQARRQVAAMGTSFVY